MPSRLPRRRHTTQRIGAVIAASGTSGATGTGATGATGRPPLSIPLIVATAIELIEADGLAALTMRKLGQALGVRAMSLYRYVPGREELLDEIVDFLIEEMRHDPDVSQSVTNGWQDFLQRQAHGVREVALRHPHCFPLIASRPPEAPWLRPPLRSVEWVEMFLAALLDDGFADRGAVDAYRAFSSFLLGHLLLEVSTMGAQVGPLRPADLAEGARRADAEPDVRTDGEHPVVARLQSVLSEDHSLREFEESLENLIERIALTCLGDDDDDDDEG